MKPTTRREWLRQGLSLTTFSEAFAALAQGEEVIRFADTAEFQTEIQEHTPRVKCFDLRQLTDPLTPNAEFFVFHQTTVPQIDPGGWKLEIGGAVERPATFTMAELVATAQPLREIEFTI